MDFDEYEYLEKAVEEPEARKDKDRFGSRRHREQDKDRGEGGEGRESKRSRPEEQNGDKRDRVERERDRDRAKDRHRSGRDSEKQRDKDGDYRSRDREYKDRDKERDSGKERERGKEKNSESERERDRKKERGMRSSSRPTRDTERELETGRSRETRERELEGEIYERESRRIKDKKDAGPESDPERDQRTVFAYQMPLKASERDVYEFFSQVGKVRDVRLIVDRNSRRSKGFGYIEFYDVMSVPLAIALSGQHLLGQPVMIKPSEAEKNLVQSTATDAGVAGTAERKIYVGNLHYNITEEQLRQIFEPFGTVDLVQLPLDETGQCRGYGFIQFAQLEHAKAAQSLNGKLDIAGRIIKVSAVTDHVAVQATGTTAVDFDDEDGGGLTLNARSRAMLMQKLDRTGTASSIAESLGVPILNGAVPIQQSLSVPVNGLSINPAVQQVPAMVEPTECLMMTNMFDPSDETEPDFDLDIKEDVQEECSKYGHVKHIFVDKNSHGHVYLQFDSVAAASICQRAMQGRWFAGRSVTATYMRRLDYQAKFGRGV